MKITAQFSTGNAWFEDMDENDQLIWLMAKLNEGTAKHGEEGGSIMDGNGNKVGKWEVEA